RELHRGRRVLVEGDARGADRRQHRAARLPEAERALHVAGDERPLEDDRRGPPLAEEPSALLAEAGEAHGELPPAFEHHGPAPQVPDRTTGVLAPPPPGQPASRIDPEDPHPASAPPSPLRPTAAPAPRGRCPCSRTRSARRRGPRALRASAPSARPPCPR